MAHIGHVGVQELTVQELSVQELMVQELTVQDLTVQELTVQEVSCNHFLQSCSKICSACIQPFKIAETARKIVIAIGRIIVLLDHHLGCTLLAVIEPHLHSLP